jgi:60 kDa SS-A/Ro ribonucleoprotein
MMGSKCIGAEIISAAEAAMVMAMVTMRKEPWCQVMGFNHQFVDLKISAADTLESSMKKAYSQGFGSTNCSMPTQYARQRKLDVDTFVIYTDNETNYKDIHPSQSLALYRKEMNKPNTKNIVVGMSVNIFTIADPKDVNSLDIVGFDSNTPSVISEFTKISVG